MSRTKQNKTKRQTEKEKRGEIEGERNLHGNIPSPKCIYLSLNEACRVGDTVRLNETVALWAAGDGRVAPQQES